MFEKPQNNGFMWSNIQTEMITVTRKITQKSSEMVDVFVGIKGHFVNLFNYYAHHNSFAGRKRLDNEMDREDAEKKKHSHKNLQKHFFTFGS